MKTKTNGNTSSKANGIPKQFSRELSPKSGLRSRYAPDLNRTELGRRIGISRPHMSRILSGKIKPTVGTMIKLRDALGMISIDAVHDYLRMIQRNAIRKAARQRTKATREL